MDEKTFYRDIINHFDSKLTTKVINNNMLLDDEWLIKIKDACKYIDNIFDNPKRFLKSEEEILNVQKIKKVTPESVKYLAKHADMVDEYDSMTGYVRPSKILNVYKDDTFNTYENRFIYTLVDYLSSFLDIMERRIKDFTCREDEYLSYDASSKYLKEKIHFSFSVNSSKERDDNNLEGILTDIAFCRKAISGWKNSEVYKTLVKERAIKVSSPIKRTNVILKNPNFQVAAALWDYLHKYSDEVIYEEDNDTSADNSLQFKRRLENSALSYYFLMKISNSRDDLEKKFYEKCLEEVDYLLLHSIIDSMLDKNLNTSKDDFLEIFSNHFDIVKKEKVCGISALENKIKCMINDNLLDIENYSYKGSEKIE